MSPAFSHAGVFRLLGSRGLSRLSHTRFYSVSVGEARRTVPLRRRPSRGWTRFVNAAASDRRSPRPRSAVGALARAISAATSFAGRPLPVAATAGRPDARRDRRHDVCGNAFIHREGAPTTRSDGHGRAAVHLPRCPAGDGDAGSGAGRPLSVAATAGVRMGMRAARKARPHLPALIPAPVKRMTAPERCGFGPRAHSARCE
jgi:hypothetical protein